MVASVPSSLRRIYTAYQIYVNVGYGSNMHCNDAYIITKNRAGIENLSDIANLPFLADPVKIVDEATSRGLDSPPLELMPYIAPTSLYLIR